MRTQDEQIAFGQNVKMYRKHRGLTQYQIPGFSHTIIARYEAGKALPRGKRLWELAKALNVRPEDLLPPTAQTLSIARHRSYARAVDAMNCEDWEAAFSAAQEFARLAFRLGDAHLIDQTYTLLASITPHISEDEVVRGVLHHTKDLSILRKLVTKAFRTGHWQWALIINEAEWRLLHEGTVYTVEDYGRIARNRGRILIELGQFADATHWYAKARNVARQRQADVLVQAALMAQAECALHAELPIPDIEGIEHWARESLMIWRMYWHHRAFVAWRAGDWASLARLLQQAHESYIWTEGRDDLLLEVMDVAVRIHMGDEEALPHVEQIFAMNINQVAGDGAYNDILFDYVHLLLDLDHPSASLEWASAIAWAYNDDRLGWVQQYLRRPPRDINWTAMPVMTRSIVRSIMEQPPTVAHDELLDDAALQRGSVGLNDG